MIGVEGQYLYKFNLAGNEDFIQESELANFKIVEEAGNLLPSFQLVFNCYDDKILRSLNEGNEFKVSFGKDRNKLVDIKLAVTKLMSGKMGGFTRGITSMGLMSALKYITDSNTFISEEKSAIGVIKDITKPYFIWDADNIITSNDSQKWIQPNVSDKSFVNDLWLHADLKDSFPAVAISSDNRFIIKDFKKNLKDYKWKFTSKPEADNDIDYLGDPQITINTGFINNWMGYGREKRIFSLETGASALVSEEIAPLLSLAKTLTRQADIGARYASTGLLNDNMHPNYWSSFLKNLGHLAIFGNVKIDISFSGQFVPIRPLDIVMFKDDQVGENGEQSSEFNSGLYIISKVVRNVQHRQFTTSVSLCRENINQPLGNIR